MKQLSAEAWLLIAAGVVVALGLTFRHSSDATPDRASAFVDVAEEAGLNFRMNFLPNEQGETFKINLYDHGCGLAVGDFDGDGHDDIFFCNQLGRCALFRNKGDGTFEDVTEKAGVGLGDRICVGATWVDYDNDGKLDLFVSSTRGGNVLFHNEGNGRFRDVTKDAGLEKIAHSQTAVFFDYDGDGHLDLFLANTAEWTRDDFDKSSHYFPGKGEAGGLGQVIHSKKEANVLYHNNGNGTFTDVTQGSGLEGRGWAGDALAFDYDGDGKPDLFVTCMFGRCQLYHNDGGGKFSDVTLKVLGKTPWGGVGAKLLDFNNDGRLDLFVADMHSDMWMGKDDTHWSLERAKRFETKKFRYYNGPMVDTDPTLAEEEKRLGRDVGFNHDEVLFGNALFRNDGGGKFTEVSDAAGAETFWPWGAAAGDFDNDGHEDLFIPSGMGYPFYYWPNYLLMNKGNGTFVDRALELGVEPPRHGEFLEKPVAGKPAARSSRCAVTADFTGTGRLDIAVNNFNDRPYLLRNQMPRRNYVEFSLRGTVSNRDAIGAVVRIYRGGQIMTRMVQTASGYLSQSSHTLHFGLGDKPDFDRIEVTWPGGRKQVLEHVVVNARNEVIEPR
jgi:hypothetical protein